MRRVKPKRHIEEVMARYPGPVTLATGKLSWFFMFAGSLAFIALVIMVLATKRDPITSEDWTMLGLTIVFCGLCALAFGAMMLPGAGSLRLTADGFEVSHFHRRFRASWRDVSNFALGDNDSDADGEWIRTRSVAFDIATGSSGGGGPTGPRGRPEQVRGMLPDTYGFTRRDFAALMTQWRERALADR
jgi:hypothetical protein